MCVMGLKVASKELGHNQTTLLLQAIGKAHHLHIMLEEDDGLLPHHTTLTVLQVFKSTTAGESATAPAFACLPTQGQHSLTQRLNSLMPATR